MPLSAFCCFAKSTNAQAITKTIDVLIAVPRLDSTPSMPILPKIAVKLAKRAEKTAYKIHILFFSVLFLLSCFFLNHQKNTQSN